jgi:GPH family glycoside/pentoside/hexuronide:cation symporter
MSQAASATPPPLPFPTKVLYASGAAANLIKARGISTFLMLFYNQVVGLEPAVVSTAIFIALVFDAFVDPTIGQWSDNVNSRLGRRHPFMYVAAIPVSVAFFLLWNPPAAFGEQQIFVWMLACLLAVRLFDTFFELPSLALLPELTRDYQERTRIIALRQLFGVVGALGMTLLAYQVFLRESPDGTGGVLSRDGYFGYALCAALLIFFFILASTAGTHNRIPYLAKPPTRKVTFAGMAKEVGATLNNRSFIVLTLSGMFMYVALGTRGGLELYFSLYFWGFNQDQLSILATAGIIASFLGVVIAPIVSAKLGKKKGAIICFTLAVITGLGPVGLRVLGLMPPNGSDLLFWIMFADMIVNASLAITNGVMLSSMIADVVEDSEVKTGRRSEGLLNSADNLFKKIVSGVGVLISGAVLTFIAFPTGAERTEVPTEVLRNLGMIYVPVQGSFYAIAILCIFLYRIDEETHRQNLAKLALKAKTVEDIESVPRGG